MFFCKFKTNHTTLHKQYAQNSQAFQKIQLYTIFTKKTVQNLLVFFQNSSHLYTTLHIYVLSKNKTSQHYTILHKTRHKSTHFYTTLPQYTTNIKLHDTLQKLCNTLQHFYKTAKMFTFLRKRYQMKEIYELFYTSIHNSTQRYNTYNIIRNSRKTLPNLPRLYNNV